MQYMFFADPVRSPPRVPCRPPSLQSGPVHAVASAFSHPPASRDTHLAPHHTRPPFDSRQGANNSLSDANKLLIRCAWAGTPAFDDDAMAYSGDWPNSTESCPSPPSPPTQPPSLPPPPWNVVALAPFVPTDDPTVGILPSTNEVFFKPAGSSFEITVVAPHTGKFQATLEGQAGSYVFGGGDGLCTQTNIASRGSTNSFKLCTTSANRVCNVYSFGHLDAPYPTQQFDLVSGVNTLSFERRESCALASQLVWTE